MNLNHVVRRIFFIIYHFFGLVCLIKFLSLYCLSHLVFFYFNNIHYVVYILDTKCLINPQLRDNNKLFIPLDIYHICTRAMKWTQFMKIIFYLTTCSNCYTLQNDTVLVFLYVVVENNIFSSILPASFQVFTHISRSSEKFRIF